MKRFFLGFPMVFLAWLVFAPLARADEAEDRAVEAIKKSGGNVGRDDKGPNAGKWRALHIFVKTDVKAVIKEVKHLNHLEMIFVQPNTEFTEEHLQGLSGVKCLKYLSLPSRIITDKGLKIIGQHKSLEVLRIGGNFSVTGLRELAGLENLHELEYGFSGPRAGFNDVRGFKKLEKLETGSSLTEEDLKGIGRIVTLKELNLAFSGITDVGLKGIAKLKNLKFLTLNQTAVTDRGVKELEALTNLEGLGLQKTKITDESLKSLGKLKNLRNLSLRETRIGDANLSELLRLEKLKNLDLSYTQMTDTGFLVLGQLKSLASFIIAGSKVTIEGRNKFNHLGKGVLLY